MSKRGRYVFDTNTLVSALLFAHSKPGQAFRQALKCGHVLLSSSAAEELAGVLQRTKFERYVATPEREEFLAALVEHAILVEPTEQIHACRDPKDDKFLELAVSGSASCIISGDDDLLVLHPFRDIAIVTPAEFLKAIGHETMNGKG